MLTVFFAGIIVGMAGFRIARACVLEILYRCALWREHRFEAYLRRQTNRGYIELMRDYAQGIRYPLPKERAGR